MEAAFTLHEGKELQEERMRPIAVAPDVVIDEVTWTDQTIDEPNDVDIQGYHQHAEIGSRQCKIWRIGHVFRTLGLSLVLGQDNAVDGEHSHRAMVHLELQILVLLYG